MRRAPGYWTVKINTHVHTQLQLDPSHTLHPRDSNTRKFKTQPQQRHQQQQQQQQHQLHHQRQQPQTVGLSTGEEKHSMQRRFHR